MANIFNTARDVLSNLKSKSSKVSSYLSDGNGKNFINRFLTELNPTSPQVQQQLNYAGKLFQQAGQKYQQSVANVPTPFFLKPAQYVAGLPGATLESRGKTTQLATNPQGRQIIKQTPIRVKNILTSPTNFAQKGSALLADPGVQAGLDLTDLLPGGLVFGGVKSLGREGLEKISRETAEKIAKEIASTGITKANQKYGSKAIMGYMERFPEMFKNVKKIIRELPKDLQNVKPMSSVGEILKERGRALEQVQSQIPEVQLKPNQVPLTPQGKVGAEMAVSSPNSIAQGFNPQDPYFNVEKLNLPDNVKAKLKTVIEDSKSEIEAFTGKKLSNKEAIDFANSTAQVLHKAVSRQETLEWEAKMLKARQLLADQANSGKVTQEYIDNLLAIKTQGTDIARKLQSLGIGADPKAVTAKEAILEAVLKVTDDVDSVLKEAKNVDFNNFNQASSFYRKFVKPKMSDWIEKIRYSSMLSSPSTHIYNISSNLQGTGLIAPLEKTIAGGLDWIGSKATGGERKMFAGEGAEYLKGYYSKLGDAWNEFLDVMKGNKFTSEQEMYNLPLTEAGTAARKVEDTLGFFPKLLQAQDRFFRVLTESGVTKALDYRALKGTKTGNVGAKAEAEALKRLFNSPFNLKEEGAVLKALEWIPMKVAEARASTNPIVSTISKFTFPFVRVPSNILKASVEYSPMGLSTLFGATNKTEQLAKSLLGTSIGMMTASLLSSDRMTWAEPSDPTKKAAFRAAGMQPYSIKIGDKWVNYSKLHPAISFNLAMVAALRDAQSNNQLDNNQVETVLNGLAKWVNFYADMSYVKNLGDFVSGIKGSQYANNTLEGMTQFVSNYPQQLIPFRALMGWVARIVDPYQRQIDPNGSILQKQLQSLATQIPFVSKSLPARKTQAGTPIANQNRGLNAFSPARITKEKKGYANIYKLRVNVSKFNKVDKEVDRLLESGEVDKAKALIKRNLEVIKKGRASQEIINQINDYNSITKEIMADKNLTEEQRQKVLKVIELNMMKLVNANE